MGGGENWDFHPIYLFNISNCCVFLTAMDVMLGNPLPIVKGPNHPLQRSIHVKDPRGKVANDAFIRSLPIHKKVHFGENRVVFTYR